MIECILVVDMLGIEGRAKRVNELGKPTFMYDAWVSKGELKKNKERIFWQSHYPFMYIKVGKKCTEEDLHSYKAKYNLYLPVIYIKKSPLRTCEYDDNFIYSEQKFLEAQ